jgi:formate dehydrogenase iron-sulfur subunit
MAVRELELAALPPGSDAPKGSMAEVVDRFIEPFRRGDSPPVRQAHGFYTDTTVCIGCKACEVACKQWNQLPSDGLNWTGNSYDNTGELSATSWRHVKFIEQVVSGGVGSGELSQIPLPLTTHQSPPSTHQAKLSLDVLPETPQQFRWLMMSDVCKHCVTAPCQQACPTGAIIHNEFVNVYIQQDICNGCSYCIAACPFGVITRASFDGHSHKCTLCYDRQRDGLVPACAKACPTQSIQFGPVDELRERARQRVLELQGRGVTGAHLYGDVASDTYSSLNSFYLLVDRPSVYGLPEKPFNPWLHMWGDYVRSLVGAVCAAAVIIAVLLLEGR